MKRCTRWWGLLGHALEPRYGEQPHPDSVAIVTKMASVATEALHACPGKASVPIGSAIVIDIYVRDICIHCGEIVDRTDRAPEVAPTR